jgi:ATP-dependent helicase HrpB
MFSPNSRFGIGHQLSYNRAVSLPVLEIMPELRLALETNRIVILTAPPGAGKSTVVPLELFNELWLANQRIIMLQPRRLAALAVAARMAAQLGQAVGQTVGYQVRLEKKISHATRLEVVTEGILTRRVQADPTLEGVGLVIFDEFHERSLHADTALALVREVQTALREDLRVLIMSATLDAEQLASLLNAPVIASLGRAFPVEIKYESREPDDILRAVLRTVHQALEQHEGDILVFLPGAGEIKRIEAGLSDLKGVAVRPLYGDLPLEVQQAAILPGRERRVVLATNIAETSLTIEGVRVVIDSGLARVSRFDAGTGFTRLETTRITVDSSDQRAGRAGRVAPGICYRLWTAATHASLNLQRNPEILEADLAPLALEVAAWGSTDLQWVTTPPVGALAQAKTLLEDLNATAHGVITAHGRSMHALGTHPRLAHLLLEGHRLGFGNLASDLAALLEERDPLPRDAGVDAELRLKALNSWRNKQVSSGADMAVLKRLDQLAASYRAKLPNALSRQIPAYTVGRLIALAYPERIAKRREASRERYKLANGRGVKIPQDDLMMSETWLAVAHMDAGTDEGRVYLAASLDARDLTPLERDVVAWDPRNGVLMAQREQKIGEITLETRVLTDVPIETRVRVLCETVRSEGLKLFEWTDNALQWQARISSLQVWGHDLPEVSDTALLETLELWLSPFLTGVRSKDDFKKINLENALSSILTWQQNQQLEQLAPSKLDVPSGSRIKLEYSNDGSAPVLAVRLQEVFGWISTPSVNDGRVQVLMHLLSPAYRPVQVTQDLRSFWQNTYPSVRQELKRRYPKHSWAEDPLTAEAVRGVKRKTSS